MEKKIGLKPNGEPSKVLIVDDSPLIHKMIKKAIEPFGFEIVGTAKNGKEGIELYHQLKPDIVTMDITMPIMNGLEAAESIIKNNSNAKIVMLSAMGDEDIINEAKEKGIKIFLNKPFDNEKLVETLRQLVDGDNRWN